MLFSNTIDCLTRKCQRKNSPLNKLQIQESSNIMYVLCPKHCLFTLKSRLDRDLNNEERKPVVNIKSIFDLFVGGVFFRCRTISITDLTRLMSVCVCARIDSSFGLFKSLRGVRVVKSLYHQHCFYIVINKHDS